jgi:RNA polymerase sigma factor (sigma-70 family)
MPTLAANTIDTTRIPAAPEVHKTDNPDWNNPSEVGRWIEKIAQTAVRSKATNDIARRRGTEDDYIQEAAVAIWEEIEKIRLARSPAALARRIASRAIIDHYRQQTHSSYGRPRPEPRQFSDKVQRDDYTGKKKDSCCDELDEIANEKYRRHLQNERKLDPVYAAIGKLPKDQQIVLVLRHALNLSADVPRPFGSDMSMDYEEVAAYLGKSVASVRALYARAIKALQRVMAVAET